MNLLIILRATAITLSCLWLSYTPPTIPVYYKLSPDFSQEQKTTIENAMEHFSDKIGCVRFNNINKGTYILINKNKVLSIKRVDRLRDNTVGLFIRTQNTVYLADKVMRNDAIVILDEDYKFKVTLHELGHSLGMEGTPHPMNSSKISHLSANIAHDTPKFLFKSDIEYLRTKICDSAKLKQKVE